MDATKPDYEIRVLADPRTTIIFEAIPPSPTSCSKNVSDSTAGEPMAIDQAEYDYSKAKTRQDFFEDLIINRAPENVRKKNKPTKSSSPEEVANYRRQVLDHKETKHRFVFQQWPRDPKGQIIKPENSKLGKMAPNLVQFWGATLMDFYTVRRIPSLPNLVTFSSGSKLGAWMDAQGETYAQDFVDRSREEAEPMQIWPCDIGRLIKDLEARNPTRRWLKVDEKGKGKEKEDWELPEPWPPASPFDALAYPAPWPKVPFANNFVTHYPTLQQYIPQSLLPLKLVVHDPWSLLKANIHYDRDEFQTVSWNEKKDRIHIYRLKTSTKNSARKELDDRQAKEDEDKRRMIRAAFLEEPHSKKKLPSGYVVSDSDHEPGPCKPPIFIVLPFQPNRKQPEEAHLYISPAGKIGEGNHSFVYKAEFELPRNILVDEEVCHQCVFEEMDKIIVKQDGNNGERRDPKWDMKSGKYVVKTTSKPAVDTMMMNPNTGKEETYILNPGEFFQELEYEGPYRAIEIHATYQDLSKASYCKHLQEEEEAIHPLASKVYVAAKLSINGDSHLRREAENYQAFPRHFFEHWSGFNIINPLHDPTPVGPVVPQFYGYYAVDLDEEKRLRQERKQARDNAMEVDGERVSDEEENEQTSDDERMDGEGMTDDDEQEEATDEEQENHGGPYLSPILLIENCGSPINPDELSIDDRSESGALVYRFNEEGWIHGSVARRNILRQPGPLSAWPLERMLNAVERNGLGRDWSFRLIDFGRSYQVNGTDGGARNNLVMEGSTITGWVHGWSKLG